LLNLLVAVLGDAYTKFEADKEAISLKLKCELILDVEYIFFWNR